MKILPINIYNSKQSINTPKTYSKKSCLINFDTISFGAMKKSRFHGVDSIVVEKFKAPLSKLNSHEDFQKWTKEETEKLLKRNFYKDKASFNAQEINEGRKALIKEWKNHLKENSDKYSDSVGLYILSSVLQDVLPTNNHFPPPLDEEILSGVITTINNAANKNNWSNFNFTSMYQKQLISKFLDKEEESCKYITKWIIIPSKENDNKNFAQNVQKLRTLSAKTWCTSSYMAKEYLKKGDFHIYLDKNKPVLGIRFIGDEITEIQGQLNNSRIPHKYFLLVKDYIKDKKLDAKETKRYEKSQRIFNEIEKTKKELENAIRNKDFEKIFDYIGIEYTKTKDGLFEISEYKQPSTIITFADIGINENELLRQIKTIKGNAVFKYSKATNLGNLETIGGNAFFTESNICNLGKLNTIKGNAYFSNTRIKSLGNLEFIGGNADFSYDKSISCLGKLKHIGGDAIFKDSNIESLGNIELVEGNLILENSKISDFGKLKPKKEDGKPNNNVL